MSRRGALDIAIVGMACRFPGASDLPTFWENILAGRDAIADVPPDRWDPAVFFDPNSAANDRIPCRRGGYLDAPIPFDPLDHGIMPNAVDGGEPEQFLVLDAARAALADAGLTSGVPDGRRAEVIVGRGNYFNRGNLTRLQHGRITAQTLAILESLHPEWSEADRAAIRADLKASLPPFGPASIPGQLTNATAGRVANRFDLLGASYVVDAASASSLVALELGARSLAEARADLALVGGVYLEADVDFPMVFRQLNGLSRSGSPRPFAADADGMVSGEGVGMVVLKRRADAERDGDRIYAVVRGIGVASDGRGAGLASPAARGHARAIRRAYRSSGVDPATVALIEGHGLGVPAADRAELRAIRAVFPPIARGRRALGAVSSMIGHAMPASGIAGLIKAALALHHRTLPPTLHAEAPHPWLGRDDSPVALNARTRPWVHGDPLSPRRAGVNAFGFAGINAHAILEEHPASADSATAPGALLRWETEAFLLAAPDRPALVARGRALLAWVEAGPCPSLKDLAYSLNTGAIDGPCRLGLVAGSPEDLAARLRSALARLEDGACRSIRDGRGAYFRERDPGVPARLAFLFPGEGSQYPGMLADLCPHFPEVRALFDTSDRIARASGSTTWPSELLFGEPGGDGPTLWSAEMGVNVVLSAQRGLYLLLRNLGIAPDAVLGHSSGEFLALAASGVLEVDRAFEDRLGDLSSIFSGFESSGTLPTARLVSVGADRERAESAIREAGGGLAVAIDNCPHQVVLAGEPGAVERAVSLLRGRGVICEDLPFSRAYHTPGFAPAVTPIEAYFASLDFKPPAVPLYSCATAGRMPDDSGAIRRLAVEQWTRPVRFRQAIEAMHADGLDVFVDVGARGNLAGFVEDTLRGRPAFAIAANVPRRSGLTQLNHVVASLFAQGVAVDPMHLYARRRPARIDFEAARAEPRQAPALAVGFPSMTLSEGLIERLRARQGGPAPAPALEGPPAAGTNGFHPPDPIEGRPTPRLELDEPPDGSPDEVLVGFQRSMDAFLQTQRAVMDAYLGAGEVDDPSSRFEPTNGHEAAYSDRSNGHSADFFDRETPAEEPGPWAGDLVAIVPGREATSRLNLDVEGDPVAEHHTLGGRRISGAHPEWRGLSVLPFSVMAEIIAEAASRLVPEGRTVALREVRAHRWIRFEPEPVALEIVARVEERSTDRTTVRVAIHNRGAARAMLPVEGSVFEGLVDFAPIAPEPPQAPPFELEGSRACRFTADSIYGEQWLFHGPALRAVADIGPIAAGGIEGTLRVLPLSGLVREGRAASGFRTDPIILDNFTHLLGGWGLDQLADDGDVIFPLRMEHLAIFGEAPGEGELVSCRVAVVEVERHRVRVDADIVRGDGQIWMTIRGWEDWRFHWPGRYRDGFRQPDRSFLGEPLPLEGGPGADRASAVWLEPPADMGRPIWRDVLEHVQLGPDERADYLAFPGPDIRRTHRLWGRIAAKEAARRIWEARGLAPTYPADLIVAPDRNGRPTLRSRIESDRADLPALSIAHVDGVAVALAAVDPGARVGIDLEPIVERSSGFEATAFTPGERALLDSWAGLERAERVARFWCAKEAVAKATGLGFVDGPSGSEVVSVLADGIVGVRLWGKLAASWPELADRPIRVITGRRGDHAWAWTLGERMGR